MSIVNKVAYEQPEMLIGVLEANVDMSSESTWQYSAVDVAAATGSGLTGPAALVACADGAAMLGVLQNNPQLAEAGTVMSEGISKIKCGGTFAIGDLLMVSGGAFVLATTGNYAVAKALEAGVSGIIACAYLGTFGKV
jgi:hypothetical protein